MLTRPERRGLSLLLLVFVLGAARDLWIAHRGMDPVPPARGLVPALAPAAPPAAAVSAPATPGADTVDVNRAGAEELDRLPGIGPVLAGRILAHRERHGPFRDPDELLAVPGIGPRLLERLRPRIRTGTPGPPGAVPVGMR